MSTLAINVTEFSRGLSDFLNQVQYRGQVLDIERGKRVVARVSPVSAADGFPVSQLDALFARGPHLDPEDRKAMLKDLRAARTQLPSRAGPWAS
jgi:antitoxin (DNA-binding transcriptional repressor) of toxin-antitoxin stability system